MAVIISGLITIVPCLWVFIDMLVIYTIPDAILPLLLLFVASVAFYIAIVSVFKKTSTFYLFLYFGFISFIFIILTIISYVWFFVPIFNIWGMVNCVKITNKSRRFFPNFKNIRARVMALLAIIGIIVPVYVYFVPPAFVFTLEMEGAASNLEINFTYANETEITPELLNILKQCNDLPNINVSLTIPILEDMMISNSLNDTNTTRDDDRPFRGDYTDIDEYEEDLRAYERTVIQLVENTDYEDLDDLVYLTTSLAVNESKKFHENGIAIDFMPLLSKAEYYMYINDKTIDRFNKTITIFKNWIEKSGLQTAHRGIIIDTERDWGNDLETILDWWNYSPHKDGIIKLGKLIDMCKSWEFEWKNGNGTYNAENYQRLVDERKTFVAGATFGLHVDDLFDFDDAQQNLFKISILPPKDSPQFDFIGIMTYETGMNSEHAVYDYCRAGDYFFGERNVPYIYSGIDNVEEQENSPYEYFNEILRKFRICQNYGYDVVGIWALISEYCFETGWCGGLYDFFDRIGKPELIFELCKALNTPADVSFVWSGYNFSWVHGLATLLDVYLVTKIRYGGYPINGYNRIRM
ncbi:MAG: hypothetical protein ACTSWN_03860 [Promethearchaeota archaeon]